MHERRKERQGCVLVAAIITKRWPGPKYKSTRLLEDVEPAIVSKQGANDSMLFAIKSYAFPA